MRSRNLKRMMARAICVLFGVVLVIVGTAAHGRDGSKIGTLAAGQTAAIVVALGVEACVDGLAGDCDSSADHDRAPSECSVATCFLIMPRQSVGAGASDSIVRLAPPLCDTVADGRIRERLDRPPRTV